jgi:RHS repeat-associated protein
MDATAFGSFARYGKEHITFDRPGYLYIYLANETTANQEVYFDDLNIVHESAEAGFKVTQVNEYYPFGMATANSWADPSYLHPGHLYQGLYAQYDSLTGTHTFQLRNYDPALGRWWQTDPYMQFANPYLGMGNMPHIGVDPDGGFSFVGAFLGMLITGYSSGVISSGHFDPGKWEKNDWAWAVGGAVAGFIGGGLLGDALHSSTDWQHPGQANAWDKFTSIFGDGKVNGDRYFPNKPNVGKLKYPTFKGWLEKTSFIPEPGDQKLDGVLATWDVFPTKFSKKHVKNVQFRINTSKAIFKVAKAKRVIFSNEYDDDQLKTPVYANDGSEFRPIIIYQNPPTMPPIEHTPEEIEELKAMGIDESMLPSVGVYGIGITVETRIKVKRMSSTVLNINKSLGWIP